jgi:broad specificity phosphatase PhoE
MTIMFLRHAEKPGEHGQGVDQHGETDPHSLSVRGWTRAGALAALFDHVPAPARPGLVRPQRILATKPTHEYRSKRERDTAEPTAARLGVTVDDSFTHHDAQQAAQSLLAGDDAALVVWHHGSLPDLLHHFPIANTAAIPSAWPEDRFDLIWVLTRQADGTYAFVEIDQDLLADDRASG